jgi:hypothetical protein
VLLGLNCKVSAVAKKKGKVRGKGQGRNRHEPKGFDFGIDEKIALIGAIEFNNSLRRAAIFGCVYGTAFNDALEQPLPIVSLIGGDQTSLEEAFREFHRWDEATHGDALDLTFVFLNGAGYLIGISPTREYLDKRFLSMNLIHDPLYSLLTWVKPIDTRSIGIEQIRKYKSEHLISPILFGGVIRNSSRTTAPMGNHDLLPIAVEPLLKFRVTFIDEDDVQPHTAPGIVLEASREMSRNPKSKKDWPKPPSPKPSEFLARRSRFLAKQFPVTVERLRLFSGYQQLFKSLIDEGFRFWQCEQAFCNLLLSIRLCSGKFHYTAVSFSQLHQAILDGLRTYAEVADGTDTILPLVNTDALRRQILLDSEFLLKHRGVSVSNLSTDQMQAHMSLHGLLDTDART